MKADPERTKAPEIRTIPVKKMPEATRETLPNGVELVVTSSGSEPVSRLTVRWLVGRLDVDRRAAYNVMRQMFTEGTSRHSGAEIASTFETCGAWVNAEGYQHSTNFTLYMLNHTAGELLPLVREIITDTQFAPETLVALREKFAANVQTEYMKPKTISRMNSTAMVYGEHHPQNRYILPEDYRALEVGDIRALYDRMIRRTVPTIYLCGKIDDELKDEVRRVFGSIDFGQGGVERRVLPPTPSKADGDRRHTMMPGSMQTAINIAMPIIRGSHPDFEMLRVAVFALGGYFGSRLMSNIREEKGYTYGISASITQGLEGTYCEIVCEAANEYTQAVLQEVEREIKRLASEPIGDEEMEIVRNTMMASVAAMFDSPFTMMDFRMRKDLLGSDIPDIERRMAVISSVTPADVMRMVRTYLLDAPRYVATAGGAASEGGAETDVERR